MAKRANLLNKVFGRLTVCEFAGKHRNGNMQWRCLCECGGEKIAFSGNLLASKTLSCGCLQIENRLKHGHAGRGEQSLEYSSWMKMKRRCVDSNNKQWKDYGGRGITFCKRWKDFNNFLADMGPMPSKGLTIERIENNGNYEPTNCRWATMKEQGRNRRDNRLVTYLGETLPISEWAEITELRHNTICGRLDRGWSVEEALTKSPNKGRSQK